MVEPLIPFPHSEKSIPDMLLICNVPMEPATPDFRNWLACKFPNWIFRDEFCDALPAARLLVERGDWSLFSLSTMKQIIAASERSPGSDLLSIGALMDGSHLVIDTSERNLMVVGKVNQLKAMARGVSELDRGCYTSFGISYVRWLRYVWENPDDPRY